MLSFKIVTATMPDHRACNNWHSWHLGQRTDVHTENLCTCGHGLVQELTALGEAVGTVSKGISEAQIAALPLQRYSQVAGTTAGCSDEQ